MLPLVDEIDEQLIRLLQKDARRSSGSLAAELKVSSATVRRRINRLTQNGILRIVALTDPTRVGYPLTAAIALKVETEKLDDLTDRLAKQSEVKWLSSATGRFDIIAVAQFRSTNEITNFLRRVLANQEGVKDTETYICLEVKKGRYMPI